MQPHISKLFAHRCEGVSTGVKYDRIECGRVNHVVKHSDSLLEQALTLLKPGGVLSVLESTDGTHQVLNSLL